MSFPSNDSVTIDTMTDTLDNDLWMSIPIILAAIACILFCGGTHIIIQRVKNDINFRIPDLTSPIFLHFKKQDIAVRQKRPKVKAFENERMNRR